MADSDFKMQVLAATDIVALVSQSVALKRRGKNYVGLCPFHSEKTPSFNVDPVKGYYKCFGCKESGNAIDFVIKRDRLSFMEAMRSLGEAAGLEMPKFGLTKEKTSERHALLDLHTKAAEYFHRTLLSPAGQPAREYLASRGFTDATIQSFRLGYAPPGWDHLLRSRELAGADSGLLALGGLVKSRTNGPGHYDTFRNRLMFPIRDEQGRVIAFGGRVMPGSDDPAKYLNSPETPLFSKSRCVFGLDLGRPRIVETRTVAVVEGYTDVAMAHQFGASNVVSILGTAMTDQHLQILRRFADRVVLLFDADTAGETAVNRAVELFLTQPVEIAIAALPDDLDPDEYLLKHGAPALDQLLKDAADALSFKWKLLQREYDDAGGSLTGQQKAIESYLNLLASARSNASGPVDELRWGAVLSRVARLTGIQVEQLQRRFRATPAGKPAHYNGARVPTNPNNRPNPPIAGEQPSPFPAAPRLSEAANRAERWILGILLADPARWIHIQGDVSPSLFAHPVRKRLAELFWDRLRNEGEPTFPELLSELSEQPGGGRLRSEAIDLLEEAKTIGDVETTVRTCISYFKDEPGRHQESKLTSDLQRKEEDESQVNSLRELQARMSKPDPRRLGPPKF